MADGQTRKGAANKQEHVRHNYESVKATIRRPTRGGGNIPLRNSPGAWREREKARLLRRIKVVHERADDDGSSEKWSSPVAQVLAAQDRTRCIDHL